MKVIGLDLMFVVLFFVSSLGCTPKKIIIPKNLKIIDKIKGTGKAVGPADTVWVSYVGRFENGLVFDSGPKEPKGRRYYLKARSLIEGWRLGVPGMKVGGTRILKIPPELAYGKKGKGQRIPPNSTLIFEIKLHKID